MYNYNLPIVRCDFILMGYSVHCVARTASVYDDIVVKLPIVLEPKDESAVEASLEEVIIVSNDDEENENEDENEENKENDEDNEDNEGNESKKNDDDENDDETKEKNDNEDDGEGQDGNDEE